MNERCCCYHITEFWLFIAQITDPSPEERARETHLDEAQVNEIVGFHEKTLAVWLWKKQWIKIIQERKGCRSYLKCKLSHSSKQFFMCSHFKNKFLLITLLLISLSIQFSSFTQLCLTLWGPMDCSSWCQASLSITNSRSSLKLMSIESVMPSSHLISVIPFSSCPQSLPASESFPMSQLFPWGG